jgi:hypothetical protein
MRTGAVVQYAYLIALSAAVALLFFLAYVSPDRNRLTRFVSRMSAPQRVRGTPSAPRKLLLISIVCASVAVLITTLFIRDLLH